MIYPGQQINITFTLPFGGGPAVDADFLPTGVLLQNNANSGQSVSINKTAGLSGSGSTVAITTTGGAITGVSLGSGGSGYPTSASGFVLAVSGGTGGLVKAISSGGAVTSFSIIQGGSGYSNTTANTSVPNTGRYNARATLPSLTQGDSLEILVQAVISNIVSNRSIWADTYAVPFDATTNFPEVDVESILGESPNLNANNNIIAGIDPSSLPANFVKLSIDTFGRITFNNKYVENLSTTINDQSFTNFLSAIGAMTVGKNEPTSQTNDEQFWDMGGGQVVVSQSVDDIGNRTPTLSFPLTIPAPEAIAAQYDCITPGTGTVLYDINPGSNNNATFLSGFLPTWQSYGLLFGSNTALTVPAVVWNAVAQGGAMMLVYEAGTYATVPPPNGYPCIVDPNDGGSTVDTYFAMMDGRLFNGDIFNPNGNGPNLAIPGPYSFIQNFISPRQYFLNGVQSPGAVGPNPVPEFQPCLGSSFQIGAIVGAGNFANLKLVYAVFWNRPLASSEALQAHQFAASQASLRGVTLANPNPPNSNHVVFQGCSNLIGEGPLTPGQDIASLTRAAFTNGYAWENLGLGQQTAATMFSVEPGCCGSLAGIYTGKKICILFETGINDLLQGASTSQTFTNIENLVGALASEFQYVFLATMIPYDSAIDANRLTVNMSIRGHSWPSNVTLVDVGGTASLIGNEADLVGSNFVSTPPGYHLSADGLAYAVSTFVVPYLQGLGFS